jgi:MFS family permease
MRLTLRRAPLALATMLAFGLVEAAFFGMLPLWGLAAALTPEASALLLSVWIGGNIVLQLPLGWLADRIGRRRVLLGCAVVPIATLALMGPTAGDRTALWAVLGLMGAAMGGLYTMSVAVLGQAFRGAEQAMAATALIIVFELGVVLGPALAGAGMQQWGAGSLPLLAMLPMLALLLASPLLASPVIDEPRRAGRAGG